MWGEFEDDENEKKSEELDASASPELCRQSEDPEVVLSLPPLRDRLIHYMAASTIILKSQQRYEPDLTYQERKDIVQKLLDQKPGQFLYRFGKQLEREHLQYFLKYEGDAEVDHYLTEALKHKNEHTKKITVLNRRYSALQKLRRSGDYFSEKEMERRNPLLYDQLIGKHQTSEEREDKYKIDKSDVKFSTILLAHIDNCLDNDLKKQQEDQEYEVIEEEETDHEEEEMDNPVESGEKRLFKEEFYSVGYYNFLRGNDEDFDYGQIDTNDAYDPLDIHARDEEERYFDDDDEEENENPCNLGMDCNGSDNVDFDMHDDDVQENYVMQEDTSSGISKNHTVEIHTNDKINTTNKIHNRTPGQDSFDHSLVDITDTDSVSKT